MSVREKTIIGQKTLISELYLIIKIVENQNQAENKIFDKINSNFSKFKRERDALIQNSQNKYIIEFVIDLIYSNKIIGFLIEYAKNGSLLVNLKTVEDIKRILINNTKKQ